MNNSVIACTSTPISAIVLIFVTKYPLMTSILKEILNQSFVSSNLVMIVIDTILYLSKKSTLECYCSQKSPEGLGWPFQVWVG